MRLAAAALAGVAMLATAATAHAAQRYAAPAGTGEACTQPAPCSLETAIEKAGSNDEVIVGSGTYTVGKAILQYEATHLDVHGDLGGPMPRISGSFEGAVLAVTGLKSRVSYLEVVNESGENGLSLVCSTEGVVERVVARASGKYAKALYQVNDCTARDSLLLAGGQNAIALEASNLNSSFTGVARNLTAIASGAESYGVLATYDVVVSSSYTLDLKNSIAAGAGADLFAFGTGEELANIVAASSNFDKPKEEGGKVTDAGGNQSAAPVFVNAAGGDYREAAGSPTIDAGTADPLNGALDLAGAGRTLGPAPDIGAFETQGPPPPPPPVGTIQYLAVAPRTFEPANVGGAILSATKRSAPVGTTVTYALSLAGPVAFTVERKTAGRRVGKKCVKRTKANSGARKCTVFRPRKGSFTRSGPAGLNQFKFSGRINEKALKPGAYQLVGSAGGAVKQASFEIVK
jgi:hypothetical protein